MHHRFDIHIAGVDDNGVWRELLRIFNKEVIHTNEEVGIGDEQPIIACDPASCATDSFVQSFYVMLKCTVLTSFDNPCLFFIYHDT